MRATASYLYEGLVATAIEPYAASREGVSAIGCEGVSAIGCESRLSEKVDSLTNQISLF